MSTRRAKQHKRIVRRQKASRRLKRQRGSYYKVQDSIDKYGEHPLEPIEDERFHDTQSMRTYALTQLQPEPTLTVEVTTYIHMKPIPDDKIHCYVLNNRLMDGPRWRTINRAQTALEYTAMKMMNGYGFTREEAELAIKILEGDSHDN